LGSRRTIVGSIASVGLAVGLGGALGSAGGGCSSSGANAFEGDDGAAFDASTGGDDQVDATAFVASDASGGGADAGPYTGLRCATTPCASALAVGGDHVCALLSNGTVWCWGGNQSGELGIGTVDGGHVAPAASATPSPVPGIEGATLVAAGGYGNGFGTSCAGSADAGILCWGSNGNGVLGLGAADGATPPPLSIAPLPLAIGSVTQVALGGLFGCVLTGDGGVACWGDNSESELGRAIDAGTSDPTPGLVTLPMPATQVATGKDHTCALLTDQSVACWGAADHGQVGTVAEAGVATPRPIAGLVARQIAAGEVSTCAITSTGAVACWGGNQGGQLGRGDLDAGALDPTPQPVALPAGTTALQIVSAVGSTCALLSDRTVWCWGDNAYGELGSGSSVPGFSPQPAPVAGLSNIVQIAAGPGGWTTCALLQNGSVRCWGVNNANQLGVDTSGDAGPDEAPHPVPVQVPL
jgi:alpha-tubulin suppressor-like RCC1 family protein